MTKSTIDETSGQAADARDLDDYAPSRQVTQAEKDPPPLPRKRVFAVAALVVVCLVGYGAYRHIQTYDEATRTQHEAETFTPDVRTITAMADQGPIDLSLPGQTEAFDSSTIYPRATGYIAERRVDIGSRVRKGDLLVRIAAPDLDEQLAQARGQLKQVEAAQAQAAASLDQAKANLALANVTFKRTNKLTQQGYETVQNNDNQETQVQSQQAAVETAQAGIKVAAANVVAQQATVARLVALTQFEDVRAPYDGIITTRGIEVGDLVNADTKTGSPLFTIANDLVLRVAVNVPQTNALSIRDGLEADVTLPQLPTRPFTGRIARSSVALQNSARTLDTEVDVQNPKGKLRPGAFVTVTFHLPRVRPNVVLPAEALIFNHNGLQVATVQDDEVHLQTVAVYRDFGKTVELRDGLNGGEQVILNPPLDLQEHMNVNVKEKPPEEQAKE